MGVTRGEELHVAEESVSEKKQKPLRPSDCRSHMRKRLAGEFQEIVDGFVAAAKLGSCQHVKLATELLKPIRKSASKKKGPATRLWEKIERETQEREKRQNAALAPAAGETAK